MQNLKSELQEQILKVFVKKKKSPLNVKCKQGNISNLERWSLCSKSIISLLSIIILFSTLPFSHATLYFLHPLQGTIVVSSSKTSHTACWGISLFLGGANPIVWRDFYGTQIYTSTYEKFTFQRWCSQTCFIQTVELLN